MGMVADRGTKERALELATGCLRELGERGWCAQQLEKPNGTVCLLGAAWYANDPDNVDRKALAIYDHWGHAVWMEVNPRFRTSVKVTNFNDQTATSGFYRWRESAKGVRAMLNRAITRLTKELAG